jgi:hypothetical protein
MCWAQQYCSTECLSKNRPEHTKICRPKQLMPARIPPDNAHLLIDPSAYDTEKFEGHDKDTTYKLIIDTSRCLDEDLRRIKGDNVDENRDFVTGFTFAFLEGFIKKALLCDAMPAWWNAERRDECVKVAKTMYHWDDTEDWILLEVKEENRYGSPHLRERMRILAGRIVKVDVLGSLGLR